LAAMLSLYDFIAEIHINGKAASVGYPSRG
jgi:hypothetical protein